MILPSVVHAPIFSYTILICPTCLKETVYCTASYVYVYVIVIIRPLIHMACVIDIYAICTTESDFPMVLSDGRFGDANAPVFFDNVVCNGREARLLDCRISEGHLGLIDELCGPDLGIICPGMCGFILLTKDSNKKISLVGLFNFCEAILSYLSWKY